MKSIDRIVLKEDIINSSVLEKVHNATSVTDKVNVFNTVLADVINKHAPIVNRKIVIRPNKQWYTDDIREAKKIQRSAEKKWRKTHLEVHRQAFVDARKNTNKLITAAKQIYTKNKISDSTSNPKELFRTVNGLIKHSKPCADLPQQTTIENWPRNLLTRQQD
ncbi:ATP-dependent DNA helicase [Elysia marginata]|uniref:ATP-dependent DNA helicase n=1 Tax=Elysia marginata TaxID=1093978 RepID=A0AAV4G9K4_9GAST|nr:ATP-dependent DNA helicase [Elysia marginata]